MYIDSFLLQPVKIFHSGLRRECLRIISRCLFFLSHHSSAHCCKIPFSYHFRFIFSVFFPISFHFLSSPIFTNLLAINIFNLHPIMPRRYGSMRYLVSKVLKLILVASSRRRCRFSYILRA